MKLSSVAVQGDDICIVPVRQTIDEMFPGKFDQMPYAARVMAENLVRRSPAEDLADALDQVIGGRHGPHCGALPRR